MSQILTASEAARQLRVTDRRVRALITAGRLPAHRASPAEVALLLEQGRVTLVPAGGLIVIDVADIDQVRNRPPGYPKGRPRRTSDAE